MKIAVLMSTYNGERYLEEQIQSILNQQGPFRLELWARDDGSTDGTCAILDAWQAQGKLRWYTGKNLKPAGSFFDLVRHCPGYDLYAFADQDDFWHPDKLQTAVRYLSDTRKPAIYFANARLVDSTLAPLGREVYSRSPRTDFYSVVCGCNVLGCTMVFNGEMAELLCRHPVPETVIMHDSAMMTVCTLYGGEVFYDAKPHMDYRQHGDNVVGAQWTKWDALKDRWERISRPQEISIADQARSILSAFPDTPDPERRAFVEQVADYRKNPGHALRLACSRKTKFNGLNMAVTMRLAIFLRHR